jgi:DNA-binding Xre family transcriptional regulator
LAAVNRCARASDGHIRFGQPEALRQCVKRVTAGANCVEVELDLSGLVAILIGEAFAVEQRVSPFVMSIEAKVTRAGKGKRIVIDADVLAVLGTLSQNQIARRLGISQSTVSLIARRQAKALPFLIVSAAETEEA